MHKIKKIFLIPIIVLSSLNVGAIEKEYEFLSKQIERNVLTSIGFLLTVTLLFLLIKKILDLLKINTPRGWTIFNAIITTLLGTIFIFIFKINKPAWLLLAFPFFIGFIIGSTHTIPVPWPPFRETLQNKVEYDIWAEKILNFSSTLFGRAVDSDLFIPYIFRIWWIQQSKYYAIKYVYSPYISLFFAFIFFSILWFSYSTHEFSVWFVIATVIVSLLFGNILGTLKKYMEVEKLKSKYIVEADKFWNEFESKLFDWVSTQPWVKVKYPKEKINEKEVDYAIKTLGLQQPINEAKVRIRYWELVKKYHYLLTQQKENLEEAKIENEFKEIFQAYQILQKYLMSKNEKTISTN